jgi:hypothetical protein
MAQAPLDPAETTRVLGAKVVRSQAAEFAAMAAGRGQTVSELIREIVAHELERENTGPPSGG